MSSGLIGNGLSERDSIVLHNAVTQHMKSRGISNPEIGYKSFLASDNAVINSYLKNAGKGAGLGLNNDDIKDLIQEVNDTDFSSYQKKNSSYFNNGKPTEAELPNNINYLTFAPYKDTGDEFKQLPRTNLYNGARSNPMPNIANIANNNSAPNVNTGNSQIQPSSGQNRSNISGADIMASAFALGGESIAASAATAATGLAIADSGLDYLVRGGNRNNQQQNMQNQQPQPGGIITLDEKQYPQASMPQGQQPQPGGIIALNERQYPQAPTQQTPIYQRQAQPSQQNNANTNQPLQLNWQPEQQQVGNITSNNQQPSLTQNVQPLQSADLTKDIKNNPVVDLNTKHMHNTKKRVPQIIPSQ